MTTSTPPRTTKRKYAHQLHPHADEWEIRPLAVEVPYHYAIAIGLNVWDTGWHDQTDPGKPEHERREAFDRINHMVRARQLAFLLDALQQGLTSEEAWIWAQQRAQEESGEFVYERAVHHGVDVEAIKPYPCGPEPKSHDHYGAEDSRGMRVAIRIPCPESECTDCTEWACTCTPGQVDLECAFHNDHPDRR